MMLTSLLLLCSAVPTQAADEKSDTRAPVQRTDEEKTFVLEQMRLFLTSIARVEQGLGAGDMEQVAREAAARGRQANATLARPPALAAKESADWKAMIGAVRDGFDRIAAQAAAHDPVENINATIGATMSQCIACHQSYRIAAGGS
jgi:cytochrome c556